MTLTVHVLPDAAALAQEAAALIAARIQQQPGLSMLVATGNTPVATYEALAQRVQAATLDCARVRAIQLDEYVGLSPDDPRRLYSWMERSFIQPLGIQQIVQLSDPPSYDAALERLGAIDLAVLGLGPNGHLGFNEPPSGPDAPTRVVELTQASLESNRGYWPGLEVPRQALTAGMNRILAAREVLLLVTGAHKKSVLHRALHGPETPDVPASFLRQTQLTVLADQAAWA